MSTKNTFYDLYTLKFKDIVLKLLLLITLLSNLTKCIIIINNPTLCIIKLYLKKIAINY